MAAQVAHASVGALLMGGAVTDTSIILPSEDWLFMSQTKIVLDGIDENTIRALEQDLHNSGYTRTALIIDNGLTVFQGVKTMTALGVGPYDPAVMKSFLAKFKSL